MFNIIFDASGPVICGLTAAEDYSVSASTTTITRSPVVTPGLTSGGIVYTDTATRGDVTAMDVVLTPSRFESNASVSATGRSYDVEVDGLQIVIEGDPDVTSTTSTIVDAVVTASTGSRYVSGTTSIAPTTHAISVTDTVAGSVAESAWDSVLALVSGKTAGDATQLRYSSATYSSSSPAATPNANAFCAALDTSWISFLKKQGASAETYQGPALLIHERLALISSHVRLPTGAGNIYMWRKPDGSFVTRYATAESALIGSDTRILLLDSAVTGITPIKTLPASWTAKIPEIAPGAGFNSAACIPAITKDAHKADESSADYFNINGVGPSTSSDRFDMGVFSTSGLGETLKQFQDTVIGGDSGGPIFVLLGSEMALMSTYNFSVTGDNIPALRTDINTAGTSLLGTAFSIGTVDLAGFVTP